MYDIINQNCLEVLHNQSFPHGFDLTFLDPPFNQHKDYAYHQDNMTEQAYWEMMLDVCQAIYAKTNDGGAIYFMQREKNTEFVLKCLRETGWFLQNLIIWKKKTSAVPVANKFGKHYQVIAYATKGNQAKTFHRLRINPPLPAHYKHQREQGVFVTDVWDDIRELTSGYFAGDEAIRTEQGERFHKQQSPLALLVRIILSSTQPNDWVLDPFAGTGTTICAAHQLHRYAVGIEVDPANARMIQQRLDRVREADKIEKYYHEYTYTEQLAEIWGSRTSDSIPTTAVNSPQLALFDV
jgi:DNA modification methylase